MACWRAVEMFASLFSYECHTLSVVAIKRDVVVQTGGPGVGTCWRHAVAGCRRGHVHDDVTAHALSQPLDDLVVAARRDLDINLVRVLVGARLARPDVLQSGTAVLRRRSISSIFNIVGKLRAPTNVSGGSEKIFHCYYRMLWWIKIIKHPTATTKIPRNTRWNIFDMTRLTIILSKH